MTTDTRTPVYLLTGFLGSGKTTLLNTLVKQSEMERTLVIINEFGEIGLDHLLVSHSSENTVIELDNGCLCCTTLGDFAKTLRDIPSRHESNGQLPFDRIVVETTGLADPSPVIHTIMTDRGIQQQYRLQGVITCVDAVNGQDTLKQHLESKKQIGIADLLIITKSDLLKSSGQIAEIQNAIATINPAANIEITNADSISAKSILKLDHIEPSQSTTPLNQWLNIKAFVHSDSDPSRRSINPVKLAAKAVNKNRHSDNIRAHCFTFDTPITQGQMEVWIQIVTNLMGSNLLRLKGIIQLERATGPMVIHGVQHIFHPPAYLPQWPDEDRRTKIVFITVNIDREELETIFALCF